MQKRWLTEGFIIFFFALTIAFLPAVVSAESQWLKRATRHGGLMGVIGHTLQVGDAVKETATELRGYLKDSFDAFDAGDVATIERIDKELEKLPGKLALRAIPGSGLVEGVLDASDTVRDRLKEGWQSASEKIDRFFDSGNDQTMSDPRMALSVDEDRHEWHASEGGILDDAPLQEVTLRGYEEMPFAEESAVELTPDVGENPRPEAPGNVNNDGWNVSEETIEDAAPWGNEYDDTEDASQYAEASEPPADQDDEWQVVEEVTQEDGPWEELDGDWDDITDVEEYAEESEQATDSEFVYEEEGENNGYETALDGVLTDENNVSDYSGEENYSTAFETLEEEEVALRAAEREAELARQRAGQQRQAELARQRAEQQRQAELARQRAQQERQAELARRRAKEEKSGSSSSILGGVVGGLLGQAVDEYLGGDSGLGGSVGGLVGDLLGDDTGRVIGETLGGSDTGSSGFSGSGNTGGACSSSEQASLEASMRKAQAAQGYCNQARAVRPAFRKVLAFYNKCPGEDPNGEMRRYAREMINWANETEKAACAQ